MSDEPSSGFALRFISGKYQGGEYPLPSEKEIVIGRGGELDIVLVEDMVSRKHAKLTTQQGKIVIQDLGSTNGTFVNGEKIKRARLKEGDRVLIGTSILKLIAASESSNVGATKEELNAELDAIGRRQQHKTDITSGDIAELPLPDILTLLSTNKKTGVLMVKNEDHEGRVYLKGGRIFYAILDENDELGPLKALFRMIALETGTYALAPPTNEEFMLELEEPTDQLVADAVRQSNEMREIKGDLPEVEDMLTIPKPLGPQLSALQADELDMLQLAMNLGFFQGVLDKSPFPDLRTCQVVKSLIEREYLRA
ncbi:MAG: FHA domain-containing protein [Deltaproteobacteria bacterium]|nr:FHA domain-containing protein [Deltaproteobacteria bacterium]